MTDFRANDLVSIRARVLDTNGGGLVMISFEPECAAMAVRPDRLELVERLSPRLEDLPDGTVIRTSTSVPLIVSQVRSAVIGTRSGSATRFDNQGQSFEVIGACPGTPAWDLWLAAGELDTDDRGEWWRSA